MEGASDPKGLRITGLIKARALRLGSLTYPSFNWSIRRGTGEPRPYGPFVAIACMHLPTAVAHITGVWFIRNYAPAKLWHYITHLAAGTMHPQKPHGAAYVGNGFQGQGREWDLSSGQGGSTLTHAKKSTVPAELLLAHMLCLPCLLPLAVAGDCF